MKRLFFLPALYTFPLVLMEPPMLQGRRIICWTTISEIPQIGCKGVEGLRRGEQRERVDVELLW